MIIGTMEATIIIDDTAWRFDPGSPIDISIPLQFNEPQPNAFGVEPAKAKPCEAGDLVGDTRQGGSCNFEQYTFIPHCNGTHTECVGHITNERISVRDCLRDTLTLATLVTIAPEMARESADSYSAPFEEDGDPVITRRLLERAVGAQSGSEALIVRTSPNDESKLTRRYEEAIPPYFTIGAMQLIVDLGVKHLLVDLPSIDRLYDEGRLSNHRMFWNVDQGSFDTNPLTRRNSTVTELIYVPNEVKDGSYILNIQIAPFASDASPSRPILFPVIKN